MFILSAAFYFAAASLSGLVGRYMLTSRVRTESAVAERLAVTLAPLFEAGDIDSLYPRLLAEGRQIGGRLIVLDMDGRVQADTFSLINGQRLAAPEAIDVLEGAPSAYGLRKDRSSDTHGQNSWLNHIRGTAIGNIWTGTFVAPIESSGARVGALLYTASVQDMVDQLIAVQDQMFLYFLAFAAAGSALSLFFSRIITKPIAAMTAGIERMARGDLRSRVKVTGGGEMAHLAHTFNQMSEKLENLDDTRNQFVSNASHELKTPLSTMKILLESMIYEPDMDSNVRQEFLQDINKEIDRLTMITSDLLTLVRTDSGEVKLRRESFRFDDVIRETARRLSPLMQERDQELTMNLADDLLLFADRARIAQMIYNLLDNAIKYTPPRGKIRVKLTRDGKAAALEIIDSGIGIPPHEQGRIFDRFYRIDKARSRATGGTGLGLAIVKQIVMLHDGDIIVISDEGKGATFRVTLPTV
ncbi:MAG: cell wall metabolism sensor histidine kinase WalK [Oscillospiraceae bacterium]|nr:cell wall metabolism sensor histidine kinase WalK [Oscillospiraceae bacterium]